LEGKYLKESVCPRMSCGYIVVERKLDSRPDWARDEEGIKRGEGWATVVDNVSRLRFLNSHRLCGSNSNDVREIISQLLS
jgi:hypothetical protein